MFIDLRYLFPSLDDVIKHGRLVVLVEFWGYFQHFLVHDFCVLVVSEYGVNLALRVVLVWVFRVDFDVLSYQRERFGFIRLEELAFGVGVGELVEGGSLVLCGSTLKPF